MTSSDVANRRTVIVLNHFAQPLTSPGGTRHVELFSRLQRWDARVVAADRNLLDGSRVQGGSVLETVAVLPHSGNGVGRVFGWMSYAATAFGRAVRARRVDLLWGSSPHLLAALAAWAVARLRRAPFVLEVRDIWPRVLADMGALPEHSFVYRALAVLERFLYRHADAIVILAAGSRDHLEANGVPADRIVFIPNGSDVDAFGDVSQRDETRARLDFDGVVAVYAGAHGPANGLDLLLDAARELAAELPELRVVLVGDGAVKGQLVERARSEGLTNVSFMAPVPKTEIPALLAAADIGVHCLADVELFRSAVSPNKLYDYMAAGLPALTNTPGEVSELVEVAEAGLAVAPSKLADGLRRLTRMDPVERQRLGGQGRSHLAATRSRAAMAGRVEELLDELVSRRAGRSGGDGGRPGRRTR